MTMAEEDEKKPRKEYKQYLTVEDPYTDEEIKELKLLGANKPEEIPWGRWFDPKALGTRHHVIAEMLAQGHSQADIVKFLGMTQGRISLLANSPKVKKMTEEIRKGHFGKTFETRFKEITPLAIDTLENVLTHDLEKTKDRIAAAGMILDRSLGKPNQQIEVKSNLLVEFMQKLDKQSDSLRDVTPVLDPSKKHLDDFIDKHIGDEGVVGQRSKENDSGE